MTRIRVLRVIARANVGGPAVQMVTLAQGLDPERFDHRIAVGTVGDDEEDYLALHGIDVPLDHIPGLGRDPHALGDLHALRHLRRLIKEHRPHIVHTHTAKAGTIGRLDAWAARVPATVHSFHGHLLQGYFSPTVTKAVVGAERLLARKTSVLVAEGARVRDELLAAGVGRREQWEVLPPGIEIEPADAGEARADLGLPPDVPVLAFVGRLTGVKRPDRLADVIEAVAARTDAEFLVAGDGDLGDELRARLAPLGGRVRFLGWRPDVERVYAAADVVVLTSDNEGMPYSLIEAAHCARPVVATDVGSVSEVVADGVTGFVTAPDAGPVTEAVLRLLGDPALRSTMSAAAATRATAEYGAERLVADATRIYTELFERSAAEARPWRERRRA